MNKYSLLRIFPCQNKYLGITVHTINMIALEESQNKRIKSSVKVKK